jgi:hypothetical protein
LALSGAIAHCGGSDDAASGSFREGSGFGGSGNLGSSTSGATTGGDVPLPPEEELEEDFRVPVATGRFVWTANPESNRVALIDAVDYAIETLEAGFGPTYLAALPGDENERNSAIVLNAVSNDATLFLARDTTDVITAEPARVHANANAWSISPSGRWAIAWTDARRMGMADPTEGFQDITVVDVQSYPDADPPEVTRLSVGYRPTQIVFQGDERRAFAVTEPGVSVIELRGDDAPRVSRDVPVADEPAAEVAVTPDGDFALVRVENQAKIHIVSLYDGERVDVEMPAAVTDLDLSEDASFAVAVMRGVPRGATTGGAGAGGQGGEASTSMAGASGEGAGFTDSTIAILPIPDIFDAPGEFQTASTSTLVGSVVVPPTGSNVLLFTNAVESTLLSILDTDDETFRVVDVKAPVRALFPTDNARHAVALLTPPMDSTKLGAFSLVPIRDDLPAKLQGTDAPTLGVSVANDNAIITTRDDERQLYEAFLAEFPGLRVDAVELASAPTASGMVPDAGVAFVAQHHPEGRITFIGLEAGTTHTLTGFELGVKVVDGD